MPDRPAGTAPARPLRGPVRVYLEQGKRWVFACALDWPAGAAGAARRIAWHALDHAWEIEDRSEPGG